MLLRGSKRKLNSQPQVEKDSPSKKSKKISKLSLSKLREELTKLQIPFAHGLDKSELRRLLPKDFRTPTKPKKPEEDAQHEDSPSFTKNPEDVTQLTSQTRSVSSELELSAALTREAGLRTSLFQEQERSAKAAEDINTRFETQATILASLVLSLSHLTGGTTVPAPTPATPAPTLAITHQLAGGGGGGGATVRRSLDEALPGGVDSDSPATQASSLFDRLGSTAKPSVSPLLASWSLGVPVFLRNLVILCKVPWLQIANIIPVIVDQKLLALYRVGAINPVLLDLVHVEDPLLGADLPKSGSCPDLAVVLVLNQDALMKLGETKFSVAPPCRPARPSAPPRPSQSLWSPPSLDDPAFGGGAGDGGGGVGVGGGAAMVEAGVSTFPLPTITPPSPTAIRRTSRHPRSSASPLSNWPHLSK